MEEIHHRFILKRIDGRYVDFFFVPVKHITQAARFTDLDAFNQFITGYYAPSDPTRYKAQMIEIVYREVEDIERT